MFSMMIDSDDEFESKLTLGGYDSEKFGLDGTSLVWHDLKPNKNGTYNHWRLDMQELKFGEFEIVDTNIESVILDSGTSLILMPEMEFKKLMQLIEFRADIPYSLANDYGLEHFPCFKESTFA